MRERPFAARGEGHWDERIRERGWILLEVNARPWGSLPLPVQWTAWNIMQVFSLRPQFLWAFQRGFRHFMWDGELSRLAKEAIGVSVAQTNACHY